MNSIHFILDIGNVLVKVDYKPLVDKLLELEIIQDTCEGYDFINNTAGILDCGLISMRGCLEMYFRGASNRQKDEILDVWESGVLELNYEMIDLWEENINTYYCTLASNISKEHAKVLQSKHSIFNTIESLFSYKYGARKPSQLFYNEIIKLTKLKKRFRSGEYKGALYVDDSIENLKAMYEVWNNKQNMYGELLELTYVNFNLYKHKPKDLIDMIKSLDYGECECIVNSQSNCNLCFTSRPNRWYQPLYDIIISPSDLR